MEANEVILLGRQFGKTIERESARISEKYDFRLAELDILARIAGKKQGDTARDIIQCNRVSKAHISKCLDNLSAKGFIIIRADEKDHRLRRVELTEKARKAAREQIEVYNRCKAMLFEGVTEEEKTVMTRVMAKMLANIDREINA